MSKSILPISKKDEVLYKLYKKALSTFWIEDEIRIREKDRDDWQSLSPNQQFFLKNILAFFAGSDIIVAENLALRFYAESQSQVAKLFYGFQLMNEGVHSETYARLIDGLVDDPQEKDHLFKAVETIPAIKKKADWAHSYITSEADFRVRLIAFAVVEGIFFSGAFCSIFWLKTINKCPALILANEFISRDEALHCEFAVSYYKQFQPLEESVIHQIIKDGVDIETEFITKSLPCNLLGMNSMYMTEYIQFVANRLAIQLGTNKLYPNAKNPFSWMESISIEKKTNFFEHKVSEYSFKKESKEQVIVLSEDF
jgi:ribonucleotide reductase beta subunit family protein with ferritin-like domain